MFIYYYTGSAAPNQPFGIIYLNRSCFRGVCEISNISTKCSISSSLFQLSSKPVFSVYPDL